LGKEAGGNKVTCSLCGRKHPEGSCRPEDVIEGLLENIRKLGKIEREAKAFVHALYGASWTEFVYTAAYGQAMELKKHLIGTAELPDE
jgi:hypothetical protein